VWRARDVVPMGTQSNVRAGACKFGIRVSLRYPENLNPFSLKGAA